MPVCAPRGCNCLLTGSAVVGGSGEPGSPFEIEAGGVTLVTSVTHPGSPFQGQVIYETDTGQAYTYVSSTWEPLSTLGKVGYGQAVADQGSIAGTTVALTNLTASFTAIAGRRYRVSAKVEPRSTVSGDVVWLFLRDGVGGTVLQTAKVQLSSVGIGVSKVLIWSNNASISGAKTYSLEMQRVSGSGTVISGASATEPAFVLVEDIGLL